MTKTITASNISDLRDATTARWLSQRLAPARARLEQIPSEDALGRIRCRVFGDAAARKPERSIAA